MAGRITVNKAGQVLSELYGIVPKYIKRGLQGFLCENFVIMLDKPIVTSGYTGRLIMKFVLNENESICADGGEYVVQLLTFLEGVALVEATLTKKDMQNLASEIGRFVGRMHRSLLGLHFDANTSTGINEYHAENALLFQSKLKYVESTELRKIMEKFLNLYEKNYLPQLPYLRRIHSHGDISNGNLIISKELMDWKIVGIIDFEDCYHGYLVGDLGVGVAYLLLQAGLCPGFDLLDISTRAVKAYEEVVPLNANEKEVLYYVTLSRIVVSYATACEKVHYDPDNIEFWSRQSLHAPPILRDFNHVSKSLLENSWFSK